jgi:uncharacterized protein
MDLSFEWDPRKAAANRRKHGVSFEQAIPAFGDPLARIFDDPDHSVSESRELIVGHCSRRLLLVVLLCPAGRADTNLQCAPRDTPGEAGL